MAIQSEEDLDMMAKDFSNEICNGGYLRIRDEINKLNPLQAICLVHKLSAVLHWQPERIHTLLAVAARHMNDNESEGNGYIYDHKDDIRLSEE